MRMKPEERRRTIESMIRQNATHYREGLGEDEIVPFHKWQGAVHVFRLARWAKVSQRTILRDIDQIEGIEVRRVWVDGERIPAAMLSCVDAWDGRVHKAEERRRRRAQEAEDATMRAIAALNRLGYRAWPEVQQGVGQNAAVCIPGELAIMILRRAGLL